MSISPDEIMVVCMSRQIKDGEVVTQGLATPLVAAAYLLARRTHAPNLYFTSAVGQGISSQPAPLGLTRVEELWLDRSIITVGFVRAVVEMLPRLRPVEFFRPAQVDSAGNFNNIAIGRSYHQPRLRLPGTGGIPDVTTYSDHVYLYVPRHSRVTFVPRLDFVSGLGHHPARRQGSGPRYLVSDLGQFDFGGHDANGQPSIRLTSLHPGVDLAQIQAHTGFELQFAADLDTTPLPTAEEIELLRSEIDPLGIRQLELLSGAERRRKLHEIFAREA